MGDACVRNPQQRLGARHRRGRKTKGPSVLPGTESPCPDDMAVTVVSGESSVAAPDTRDAVTCLADRQDRVSHKRAKSLAVVRPEVRITNKLAQLFKGIESIEGTKAALEAIVWAVRS